MSLYNTLTARQIMSKNGLFNVAAAIRASQEASLRLPAACALLEKESHGRNIYGNDKGGALSGYPHQVDESNFNVFEWLVTVQGQTSNGVGPTQITFPGYFTQMFAQGLKPWDAHDNMLFGFDLLEGYFHDTGSWVAAGEKYNGSLAYGEDLHTKILAWIDLLAPAKS